VPRACAIAVEVNNAAAKAHNVQPKAVTIQQFKDAVKGSHAKIEALKAQVEKFAQSFYMPGFDHKVRPTAAH
jgi:hypothetical protein